MDTHTTKNVEVGVRFNNGNIVTTLAPVERSKFASLQSKASTYRKNLHANVVLNKMTEEQANAKWHQIVITPAIDMVTKAIKPIFPQEVLDVIVDISPRSDVFKPLDFDAV